MEKGNWNPNSQFWTDNRKSSDPTGWVIPYLAQEGNTSSATKNSIGKQSIVLK